jgi:Holliday junction DNA helicase RuvA
VIALLEGVVAVRSGDHVVVSCGGVGYQVAASAQTLASVPPTGDSVRLFTHLVSRDDGLHLYGFDSESERELFLMLLGVSSVGPKVALAILGSAPVATLKTAIGRGDHDRLRAVPGVGKRTAERICVDLREAVGVGADADPSADLDVRTLARQGLVALGIDERDVDGLLDRSQGNSPEELIQSALRESRK